MSVRQCLRCFRMKREVKRGGICDRCRSEAPGWREQKAQRQPVSSTFPRPKAAVPKAEPVRHIAKPKDGPLVTVICSHARAGESASDWTLGFEGEFSLQQRQENILRLLKTFVRVRVFIAKKLVEEFTHSKARASIQQSRRPTESSPHVVRRKLVVTRNTTQTSCLAPAAR
jgi:hypothetical protein